MSPPKFKFTPQNPVGPRGKMNTRTRTERIMIHCTADPEGSDKDYDHLWNVHVVNNGWFDIGYHWAIREGGEILECRKEHLQGAGCSGQNHDTIHVTYFGGMDAAYKNAKDTMTPEQNASMAVVLRDIRERFPQITAEDIVGHNQFAAKACPSFNVADKLPLWQDVVDIPDNPEPGDVDLGAVGLVLKEQNERIGKLEASIKDLLRWKNDEQAH